MLDSKSVITYSQPKSPISEAYRVLRTNIQYSSFDKPLKTIVMTSTGPGEGKTTTVVNVAVTFAQIGNKVLIIDADLRKPKVHRMLGLNNNAGLTNLFAFKGNYKDYINESVIENVDVITCGAIPPNPSELLNFNAMKRFIEEVKADYDMVFIDSPPIGAVTDAAILSTIVDGTILVVSSGSVQIDALVRSKELLENVNANIIGVVLNKLDKHSKGSYYYYYYYAEDSEHPNGGKVRKKRTKHTFDE